jgi:lysophospholipase L1-like esterase
MRFECGGGSGRAVGLSAATVFPAAAEAGKAAYGFDLKTVPASFANRSCASDKPFFFSTAVPDGNYRVTVALGGKAASTTTLRAESRRLLLMEKNVAAGATDTEEFVLNVRTPEIGDSGTKVKLKPREIGALDWDNKLTLEFNGEHPAVRSITVTPVKDVPTLYLAGDSTVVDQDKEPWAAWGQMLPAFFGPGLAIANHAESGETIKSFVGEKRLEKVMSTIKAGDYLAMQFAHNDQKPGGGYVPAATDYKSFLKSYISQARAKGATPILVTSMNRRTFGPGGKRTGTLDEYAAAMREVAAEEKVALIDLNAKSKTLYEALGDEGTLRAFVHYPANTFPGQTEELKDDTHFNAYGAYELARIVVQEIKDQRLPIAPYLRKGIAAFNPARPDALAAWHLPASPAISIETPYGR